MNKEFLKKLMSEKINSYSDFLECVKKRTMSEKWSAGALEAYSIEPYRMELFGWKPGRMLKKASEPGKNRYRYLLDEQEKIIGSVAYMEKVKFQDEWIHSENFYEHYSDHIVRYQFGSVRGLEKNAHLQRIVYVELKDGKPIKSSELSATREEYSETDYLYDFGKIVEIEIKMWRQILIVRNFVLKHTESEVVIFEKIQDGNLKQIYPEIK